MLEFYLIGYAVCFLFMLINSRDSKLELDMIITGVIIASFLSWILVAILTYGKFETRSKRDEL